jgi:hypothetical protein
VSQETRVDIDETLVLDCQKTCVLLGLRNVQSLGLLWIWEDSPLVHFNDRNSHLLIFLEHFHPSPPSNPSIKNSHLLIFLEHFHPSPPSNPSIKNSPLLIFLEHLHHVTPSNPSIKNYSPIRASPSHYTKQPFNCNLVMMSGDETWEARRYKQGGSTKIDRPSRMGGGCKISRPLQNGW